LTLDTRFAPQQDKYHRILNRTLTTRKNVASDALKFKKLTDRLVTMVSKSLRRATKKQTYSTNKMVVGNVESI